MTDSTQHNDLSSQSSEINFDHCTMTLDEMEKLPIPKSTTTESCVICCSEIDAVTEKLRILPCNHVFHENCLFTWLKFHAICPLCRHELKDNFVGNKFMDFYLFYIILWIFQLRSVKLSCGEDIMS